MNSKDCQNIAYIMSSQEDYPGQAVDRFCALDPRIKTHYLLYTELDEIEQEVEDLFHMRMVAKYGRADYYLLRACSTPEAKAENKRIREECVKEIEEKHYNDR